MHKLTFATLAAVVALAAPAYAATEVTVENIGAVLNESLALPAQDTPGSGIGFEQFFEFTLPTSETVTVSVSDSAIGAQRITSGLLSLNTWTSTAPSSPFQPIGALIESSPIVNVIGGQEATVAPDVLAAGSYFALVEGVSGTAPIHIAIDGTMTAVTGVGGVPTPEPSTWAMLAIGFGLMSFGAFKKRGLRVLSFGMEGEHA
jgi:hypothetical protein